MTEESFFYRCWLPNILSEAELIVEEQTLRRAWLLGVTGETSVVSPEELLMQTRGLGFEEDWPDLSLYLRDHAALIATLMDFKTTLLKLEAWLQDQRPTGEALFASRFWVCVKHSATRLLEAASDAEFSSSDFALE
jgi:hypothetical protein